MNTIIMIFALPIGIFWLIREKRAMRAYEATFDNFFTKVYNDTNMNREEKINLLEKMLYQNGYRIVHKENHSVTGEKKIFSIGWMFIGIGTLYVGLIIYILWYLNAQKPHIVAYTI